MSDEENVAEETPVEAQPEQEVPDEFQPPTDPGQIISLANREFIRNNYKKLDLPSLSMATNLPPEVVAMYVEVYEEYVQRSGGSVNEKVNFIMSVDEAGNVNFGLQWPTLEKSEKILPYLGKAIYLLNAGRLKENVIQFFIRMGEEKGSYQTIKTIVSGWKEQDQIQGQRPIIAPNEVLT